MNSNANLLTQELSIPTVQSRPPTDYELTREIENGNTESIETLYRRHKSKVYSLCLRMTGSVTEAEDLTQEVFIQLLVKAGSFRGESQFTTWLYRFATNQVLMHFRSTRQRLRFSNPLEELTTPQVAKYSHSEQVLVQIALDTALAELPSGSRSIFLKFDVEGYTHDEIARFYGCTVGNSKSQLHKARRKLRILLGRKQSTTST
ncbi:MAG TPA: RNA polymerase sigma factor [Pyrinomonadaceae bacterium]